MYIIISFILSLLLLCSPFFSRIERESSKSMSHISVRASRSFISYPNASLDKRNEAASNFKILSSSALPGKSGITSICGAVMTGEIYFCSILLPCSPASKETSKIWSSCIFFSFCDIAFVIWSTLGFIMPPLPAGNNIFPPGVSYSMLPLSI